MGGEGRGGKVGEEEGVGTERGRGREGSGGERGVDVEGPIKWSAPGPTLALGGPDRQGNGRVAKRLLGCVNAERQHSNTCCNC